MKEKSKINICANCGVLFDEYKKDIVSLFCKKCNKEIMPVLKNRK